LAGAATGSDNENHLFFALRKGESFHDEDAGEEKNFSVCGLRSLFKWKNLLVKD
jgi:hypothetical protein